MNRKIKLYLPLVQLLLAALLLGGNLLRAPRSPWAIPWTAPELELFKGINAPVALVATCIGRFLLNRAPMSMLSLVRTFEGCLRLILVPALWYAATVEISARETKGSVLTPLTRIRGVVDTALIACGMILLIYAIGTPGHEPSWNGGSWNKALFGIPCLLWGLTLVGFYARDLYFAIVGPKTSL